MHSEISEALDLSLDVGVTGEGDLPSCFAVTSFLTASVAAVGSAASTLIQALGLTVSRPTVTVDRRLASLWAARSIYPIGWELPPVWDSLAGDYRTRDGWIKLHTNLPHHRRVLLDVLGCSPARDAVARAVREWDGDMLESAVIDGGGVAAMMRSASEWAVHPQGQAVRSEPLIHWRQEGKGPQRMWSPTRQRPLGGLRVLDLTRVIAGPVATRMLAGFGATVLRIDPPAWSEPNVVPEVTLGKRCAHLKLDEREGFETLTALLEQTDVLVHGYRPGALDGLGLDRYARRSLNRSLIEVALDAYGWTGPWAARRGFDSLVQMSCGIADAGMEWAGRTEPVPLPVQALDHATGYLMAAAVLRGLIAGVRGDGVRTARLSLARTGALLSSHRTDAPTAMGHEVGPSDFMEHVEQTPWGDSYRLRPPLSIDGTTVRWELPAGELGSSRPTFP